MISLSGPIKNYKFFLKTNNSIVSEHKFFLKKDSPDEILAQIRKGGNIYEAIPELKSRFLGGKNVKLKYGCFFGTESVLIDQKSYSAEPEQIGGLLLPHYQILSRQEMDKNIIEMELNSIEHKLFVKALDGFPKARQFHRMRSFEFEPVNIEDIVLNADQLRNN
jgi:hypothetical protein